MPALALAKGSDAEDQAKRLVAQPVYRTPGSLDRYIDPLPIPTRIAPYGTRKGTAEYRVRMLEFAHQMHSQLPPATVWGYEGQYPGPLFDVRQDEAIEVLWENHLPTRHIFEVDPHIHGAMPPAPAVRTVPHLHGARTSPESDGLPEKWFTPGKSVRYHYPNSQPAATLWYHDHAVGITRLNVYAGLSGFYLLRGKDEPGMNLPSGEYEIPLVLQDRLLDDHGQLIYAPTYDDGQKAAPGTWGPQFFGNFPVVNGAIYPYLEVEPRRYRLRVLNAANTRFFQLYFNLARNPTDIPALVNFHQIGTDGGFLSNPVELNKLLISPAERADLIIDFSGLQGKTVTLSNNAAAPYPGWGLLHALHPPLSELMQFRVTRPLSGSTKAFSMPTSVSLPVLEETKSVVTRDFVLSQRVDKNGHALGMQINGKGYDDPVTEFPKLGTLETWRFINPTDDSHPMHLHLVQFRILHRQGFDPVAFYNGKLQFIGSPRPPAANEAGWKDTAIVNPREVLTLLVPFEGYTGRYVFHCHVAEHEDNDMMRPFEVVPADSHS